MTDEEIKTEGENKWKEANVFFEKSGGVNPTPFMMGFNSGGKFVRSRLSNYTPITEEDDAENWEIAEKYYAQQSIIRRGIKEIFSDLRHNFKLMRRMPSGPSKK